MSSVKSKNNKSTELRFISLLKKHNIIGWRRNFPLFGKPDFVFPNNKIAIFLDGCFWHMCPMHCRLPSSNNKYWKNKINNNKMRDKKTSIKLKAKGWKVIRIWEHEINDTRINTKISLLKQRLTQ